jgi:hypothetical protein
VTPGGVTFRIDKTFRADIRPKNSLKPPCLGGFILQIVEIAKSGDRAKGYRGRMANMEFACWIMLVVALIYAIIEGYRSSNDPD